MNAPGTARPRRRRWTFRLVRSALIAYCILILVLSLLQTNLIFPGAADQGHPSTRVSPPPGTELVRLTTPARETVTALFGPALAPKPAGCPSVLFFYGNGMSMADCFSEFNHLRALGFNVLIPDYLGYGMSSGKPSEAGVYATANAAFAHLQHRADIDPHRIVVFGWSLGGAAAIDLAARDPVAGLITASAFTSMSDMARRTVPIFPTGFLLKHHFDNEKKIAAVTCPILIIHGQHDSIVPHAMSARLAAAAKSNVTVLDMDSDHNDIFELGSDDLWSKIAHFINGLRKQ